MKEDSVSEDNIPNAKSVIHKSSISEENTIPHNLTMTTDKKRYRMTDHLDESNGESMYDSLTKMLPKEASITAARFEGPKIALYTKNPKFALTELTLHLSGLSKTMKKKVCDPNGSKYTDFRGFNSVNSFEARPQECVSFGSFLR